MKDKGREFIEKIDDKRHELLQKWEDKSREFIGSFLDLFGREGRLVSLCFWVFCALSKLVQYCLCVLGVGLSEAMSYEYHFFYKEDLLTYKNL